MNRMNNGVCSYVGLPRNYLSYLPQKNHALQGAWTLALWAMIFYCSCAPLAANEHVTDSLETVRKRLEAAGRNDTMLVRVLNELAMKYEESNPKKSLALTERSRDLAEQLGDKKGLAKAINVRGLLEVDAGNYDAALELHFKALALREEIGDKPDQARSLNNIGIVYRHQGKYELATEYYFKSLRIKESLGDKKGMASSMSNIGRVLRLQGKHEQALEYEFKSLGLEQELGNTSGQAASLNNIGEIYVQLNKLDRALEHLFKSKTLKETMNDKQALVVTLRNIGAAYRLQRKTVLAARYYENALKLTEELGNKDGIIACFQEIAEFYLQTGNSRAALSYATRSLQLADSIGAPPRIRDALLSLSSITAATGDHKRSLEFYKRFVIVRDSLVNAESLLNVAQMQARYTSEQKDQEIKLLNQQKQFQTLLVNSLVAGVVFLLALAFVLVRLNRVRRKSEGELRQKNAEITRQQAILEDQAAEIETSNTELQEKNIELEKTREESEQLLLNVLPAPIAERLKSGERTIADRYDSVTVLFADIVDFTRHSSNTEPERLVEGLNAIFVQFDLLAARYNLEKIKTIGDAYMLAGGLPERTPDHCSRVAMFALEAMNLMHSKALRTREGGFVALRIGIHTGSAVAGVIGSSKFTYDLWGDTVNTASRMESHGEAGQIHCSEAVFEALQYAFVFAPRGTMNVKGKGQMRTYFLQDKRAIG